MITPKQIEDANRALYWINLFKPWALAFVAVGVAYEFLADRLERPHNLILDTAREEEKQALEAKIAETQRDAAIATQKAEEERLTRLEMEQSLTPRILVWQDGTLKRLQRSSGTKYVLEFVRDAEAERLVNLIAHVLMLSDWEQVNSSESTSLIRDGIAIEAKPVDGKTPIPAAELAEYLEANGLQVWTASLKNPFRLEEIPDGAVRIRVGLKPNPYFEKQFADRTVRTKKLLDALSTPGLERKERSKEEIERLRTEWQLPKAP